MWGIRPQGSAGREVEPRPVLEHVPLPTGGGFGLAVAASSPRVLKVLLSVPR